MNKKSYLVLTFIIIFFLTIALFAQEQSVLKLQEINTEKIVNEYVIGPRDLLEIKVFESPELDQTVRVSEDGSITIPLIGKVMVGGLTKDAVEEKIAGLLDERFVKNAKVSIFIKEHQSNSVSVIGAVNNPGMYELIGRRTLLQMITQAGGFADNAGDSLFVLREGANGGERSISIDLEELIEHGDQNLNIPLQANDVINVPVDKVIQIFVFGCVRSPGAQSFKLSDKVTLLQAIAKAGGLAEGAKKKAVLIKRRNKDGKEINITVNLKDIIKGNKPDIDLQKGDVVYVPESKW